MHKPRRVCLGAALAVLLTGAALYSPAAPARASTGGCTSGVYTGYCGTEQDMESTPLSFDVYRQARTVGTPVIGYPDSDTDPATDFFIFAYDGTASKIVEYAPGGVASGLCVSEPSFHAGLVLRLCNGSNFQQYTASDAATGGDGYTWTNRATGDIVQANGYDKQFTGVTATASTTVQQEFTFTG